MNKRRSIVVIALLFLFVGMNWTELVESLGWVWYVLYLVFYVVVDLAWNWYYGKIEAA